MHHNLEPYLENDKLRDEMLTCAGFVVKRYSNNMIDSQFQQVLADIYGITNDRLKLAPFFKGGSALARGILENH